MDQLALQSTFAKIRNPYGIRRWAYMEGSDNPTPSFRVHQLFGVAGQPYGENNAPVIKTRVRNGETLAQLVPSRDQWVRPATRWFKAVLTLGTTLSVAAGTPFLAQDPFQSAVEYKAKPGDDIFMDDGAGTTYEVKIAAVDPAGNEVTITTKSGFPLPANGTYYVKHTLDAFFVQLTTSFMLPQSQFAAIDPATHPSPCQSKIQVTYFDNGGTTVVEQYERVPIRELSTIATDVPFAYIEVLGDRFGAAAAPADPYYQVFEVFEFHLARVPDKLEVIYDNTGPVAGPSVELGNVAVYYGSTVPAQAAVPPNILTPNPAPTSRYNLYPPPDPEDFWTGSGDIVLMPVGTTCPSGYEDIAQVVSRANDHYVSDSVTGLPVTFAFSTGSDLAMALDASGNTVFSGTIAATAVDPSNPTVPLRSSSNNTSTFEVAFLLYLVNGAFRTDQPLTFRIPEIQFQASGAFSFTILGDVRGIVGRNPTSANDCRIFVSGVAKATSLANAGKYEKPVQTAEDATPVDDPGASLAPFDDQLGIPLAEVFVAVNDLITFTDEDGTPLAAIDVGGSVLTGPEFRVKAINVDEGTVTVADRIDDDTPTAGRTTEVWRFCGDTATPANPLPNFYRVFSASTNHTHVVGVGDAELKSRKDNGSFVTSLDHTHQITEQSVIVPYVQFKFCVKL